MKFRSQVIGLVNATSLGGGGTYHVCASVAGGTISCWGYGGFGQMGNGLNLSANATPVPVSGLSKYRATVALGQYYSCACRDDGVVQCWGRNGMGQLGNNATVDTNTPVSTGLDTVVDLAAATDTTCSIHSDGTAQCWGDRNAGTLGDGTTSGQPQLQPGAVKWFP